MTNQEVEEIKGHFDKVAQELRAEFRGEFATVRAEAAATAQDFRGEIDAVREDLSASRRDAAAVADHLKAEIAEVRHYTGVVAEDLRSEIRAVSEGVALANERINDVDLRVDTLTHEVRRGFAGVRAEIHRLHETDDDLRRRIETLNPPGA